NLAELATDHARNGTLLRRSRFCEGCSALVSIPRPSNGASSRPSATTAEPLVPRGPTLNSSPAARSGEVSAATASRTAQLHLNVGAGALREYMPQILANAHRIQREGIKWGRRYGPESCRG